MNILTGYEPKHFVNFDWSRSLYKWYEQNLPDNNMTRAVPRRGGIHPTCGVFIGGAPLNNNYGLAGQQHYWFIAQQRGATVINSTKQALLSTINLKDSDKF